MALKVSLLPESSVTKLTVTRRFGDDGVQRLLWVPGQSCLDLDLGLMVSSVNVFGAGKLTESCLIWARVSLLGVPTIFMI